MVNNIICYTEIINLFPLHYYDQTDHMSLSPHSQLCLGIWVCSVTTARPDEAGNLNAGLGSGLWSAVYLQG